MMNQLIIDVEKIELSQDEGELLHLRSLEPGMTKEEILASLSRKIGHKI